MHLLKIMLKANGRCGVPQGGVISPLLSNLYLNEVDRWSERRRLHDTASTPLSSMRVSPMTW
jgi:retron-type reverse transcriptase